MSTCRTWSVTRLDVTPRPTDSTGEFENLSDKAEELCRSELKKCLRVLEEQAPLKGLDEKIWLTTSTRWKFLETAERVTRDKKIKMCRMQWSNIPRRWAEEENGHQFIRKRTDLQLHMSSSQHEDRRGNLPWGPYCNGVNKNRHHSWSKLVSSKQTCDAAYQKSGKGLDLVRRANWAWDSTYCQLKTCGYENLTREWVELKPILVSLC